MSDNFYKELRKKNYKCSKIFIKIDEKYYLCRWIKKEKMEGRIVNVWVWGIGKEKKNSLKVNKNIEDSYRIVN